MRLGIEKHVAQSLSCAQTKDTIKTAPILEYPLLSDPLDVVSIDRLQLPRGHQGSTYVLVCVDHFSRPVALSTKSPNTEIYAIVSNLICPYTTPLVFFSDNGMELKKGYFKISVFNLTSSRHLLLYLTLFLTAS